ncbi:hypothetical protein [Cedecea sp. P7760]|uniref:hypothetical protein n=1 Tax=Cedecea sp. P7760 TaxID=2726983 RepID=UPI0015A447BE|nr:hypothetical protein [Cedecea sp. P7760]NWC63723.1 hypothetical protein [Cedecea sp. P7760]
MSKKKLAEKKFCEAMELLNKAGECPVNYCLSYVRGFMCSDGSNDYLHEWDDACMRIKLTEGEQIH